MYININGRTGKFIYYKEIYLLYEKKIKKIHGLLHTIFFFFFWFHLFIISMVVWTAFHWSFTEYVRFLCCFYTHTNILLLCMYANIWILFLFFAKKNNKILIVWKFCLIFERTYFFSFLTKSSTTRLDFPRNNEGGNNFLRKLLNIICKTDVFQLFFVCYFGTLDDDEIK